jgi:hypothetical protein
LPTREIRAKTRLLGHYRSQSTIDTGIEGCYSQFQTLTSRGFESKSLWATKNVKNGERLDNLRRVYSKSGNLTFEIRKNY